MHQSVQYSIIETVVGRIKSLHLTPVAISYRKSQQLITGNVQENQVLTRREEEFWQIFNLISVNVELLKRQ